MRMNLSRSSRPPGVTRPASGWVAAFVRCFNHEQLYIGIALVTPADRHEGRDEADLDAGKAAFVEAKAQQPQPLGQPATSNREAPNWVVRARRKPAEEVSNAASCTRWGQNNLEDHQLRTPEIQQTVPVLEAIDGAQPNTRADAQDPGARPGPG